MSFITAQMARHLGAAGRVEESEDRAVTVRPSSTANFYVDSTDKLAGAAGDFVINKNQALFNGFFHRIAVGEVVLDWGLPNIAQWWGNNFLTVYVDSGVPGPAVAVTATITDGFYTSLEALQALVTALNAAPALPVGVTFSITTLGTTVRLTCSAAFVIYWAQSASDPTVPSAVKPTYLVNNALVRGLFSSSQLYTSAVVPTTPFAVPITSYTLASPLVLGTRYVDITSPQLTYNQDLKDNTTATFSRDVLYRWYLAWDNQTTTESITSGGSTFFPFPIYQGFKPFNQRRVLPYPKQIRWEDKQPIGQVSFQSYDDRGRLIDTSKFTPSANFQFQMSMLLSEN